MTPPMQVRRLGPIDAAQALARMQAFTAARDGSTPDELWLCEHPPVYTLGIAARPGHLHDAGAVPVLATDRGGQVTYHGPGQVVAYPLVDLGRLGLHVREYVFRLEQALLRTLEALGVTGHRVAGAPGVWRIRSGMPCSMRARRPCATRRRRSRASARSPRSASR
jgi:lipoyl(octanoyl) transferase